MKLGSVLNGKYRLERLIGSGGMASVYEGVHRNSLRVAIKILHPELCGDPELRGRFLREGYIANVVDHPGVVRVLDDDTTAEGRVFLVMDLLEGQTVAELGAVMGGRLAMGKACAIGSDLLDVLSAAHAKEIVHRDIKPDNLFLTRAGVLKVLDFGIARLAQRGGWTVTRTGRMLGTPAFMPPEQALGRTDEIDARTDVYAAGATLFTLLSGQFVHLARTPEEMLIRAGSEQARSLSTAAPDIPAPLALVIDRALAFEKSRRWSSAREMAEALWKAAPLAGDAAGFSTVAQGWPAPSDSTFSTIERQARLTASLPPDAGSLTRSTTVAHRSGSMPSSPSSAPAQQRVRFRQAWPAVLALAFAVLLGIALAVRPFARRAADSSSVASPLGSGAAQRNGRASEGASPDRRLSGTSQLPEPDALPAPPPILEPLSQAADPSPSIDGSISSQAEPAVASSRAVPSQTAHKVDRLPRSATPAGRPPSPAANCVPPFFTDEHGHRQYKLECL